MQVFIRFEVFDTITSDAELTQIRKKFWEAHQRIMSSGKVLASGVFADARGGVLLLDVSGSEELFDLLGLAILNNCRVETHPVMPFNKLERFFDTEALRIGAVTKA